MRTTIYVGSSKENNADIGRGLGLTGEALENFCYACYEVALGVEVDLQTGKAIIVAVDERPLPDPPVQP